MIISNNVDVSVRPKSSHTYLKAYEFTFQFLMPQFKQKQSGSEIIYGSFFFDSRSDQFRNFGYLCFLISLMFTNF
jgi:hypothetical protein